MRDVVAGVEHDRREMVVVLYGVSHVSSFCRSMNLRLSVHGKTMNTRLLTGIGASVHTTTGPVFTFNCIAAVADSAISCRS
jgi:hypothetical protein